MAAPCPLLGDGITDDTLRHIAGFLPTTRDMLCCQLACPRFAAKIIAAPRDEAGGGSSGRGGSSAGDAVDRGGGGVAVGSEVQRAGTRVGAASRAREQAGIDAGGGFASGAAAIRSGACRRDDAI